MTDIGQLRSLAMVPTRLFGLHGMSYPTRIVLITAPIADLKYRANEYASLKVSVRIDNHNAELSPVLNEINMLQRMKQFADKDHPGLDLQGLRVISLKQKVSLVVITALHISLKATVSVHYRRQFRMQ